MRIAIGCDAAGLTLKDVIRDFLAGEGIEISDFGVGPGDDTDYPDIAQTVAKRVVTGEFDRGVLICGTGIGMAIVANKVPGIRAAVCHDPYSAERARKSNNAQIMTLGARVIGPELAKTLAALWIVSDFEGGRSAPKVAKIDAIDAVCRGEVEPRHPGCRGEGC